MSALERIEFAMDAFWLLRGPAKVLKRKGVTKVTYRIKRTKDWDISKWPTATVMRHIDDTINSICYAWWKDGGSVKSAVDVKSVGTKKGLELFFGPEHDWLRVVHLKCRGTPKKPKLIFTWHFPEESE